MADKLNKEQRLALVEAFHESGMSQQEYATARGIKPSTLAYWIKESRKATSKAHTFEGSTPPLPGGKTAIIRDFAKANGHALMSIPRTQEPDYKSLYEEERAKVEALQKVIAVLGYQL